MPATSYSSTNNLAASGSQVNFDDQSWYNIGEFQTSSTLNLTQLQVVLVDAVGSGAAFDLLIHDNTNNVDYPIVTNLGIGGTSQAARQISLNFTATAGIWYFIRIKANKTTNPDNIGVAYGGSLQTSAGIAWANSTYNALAYELALTYATNNPPNAPSFSNVSSNGSTINGKPKLFANVSDPDSGNTITNIEVQTSTSSAFSSNVVDDQYGSDSGYGTSNPSLFTGMPTPNNSTNTVTYHCSAGLSPGTYYVRSRCKDNNGAWSGWSATQQFTIASVPWTDTPVAGNPGMKAQWLNDLATVINNARQFRTLSTFAFTDGTVTAQTTDIKATHITERRQKLIDVLNVVGVSWNPVALSNASDRDGQQVIELRSYATQT